MRSFLVSGDFSGRDRILYCLRSAVGFALRSSERRVASTMRFRRSGPWILGSLSLVVVLSHAVPGTAFLVDHCKNLADLLSRSDVVAAIEITGAVEEAPNGWGRYQARVLAVVKGSIPTTEIIVSLKSLRLVEGAMRENPADFGMVWFNRGWYLVFLASVQEQAGARRGGSVSYGNLGCSGSIVELSIRRLPNVAGLPARDAVRRILEQERELRQRDMKAIRYGLEEMDLFLESRAWPDPVYGALEGSTPVPVTPTSESLTPTPAAESDHADSKK